MKELVFLFLVYFFFKYLPILLNYSSIMNLKTNYDQIFKLEKGFQKKTIVAFTNSTVFILDFNIMTKPCFVLECSLKPYLTV